MKAAIFYKPFDLKIKDVRTPQPKRGEVLIKIKTASVCRTDLLLFQGNLGFDFKEPRILGHDGSGTIEKVDEEVTNFKRGDRVIPSFVFSCQKCSYCKMGKRMLCEKSKNIGFEVNGTFAKYLTAPADFVFKIPKAVSFEEAAIIEPIEVALHIFEVIKPRPGETMAILGQGPIGLILTQVAKYSKLKVISLDIYEEKLRLSKKLGADFVINSKKENPRKEILKIVKEGADYTVETAGLQETVDQTVELTKPLGKIVFLGQRNGLRGPLLTPNYIFEQTFFMVESGSGFGYQKALRLLAEKKIDVKSLISHIVRLEDLPKIFQQVAEKKIEPLRILVNI